MIKMIEQITNFNGVKRYYCRVCECYHKKTMIRNGKKIILKPFKNHKEFAIKLTKSQIFNRRFLKSFNNYSVVSHKKQYGSRKQ